MRGRGLGLSQEVVRDLDYGGVSIDMEMLFIRALPGQRT